MACPVCSISKQRISLDIPEHLINMVTDHFTHRDYPHKVTDSIIITTEDATKDLPDFLLALNLTLSFEYILFKNASGPVLGLKHFLC